MTTKMLNQQSVTNPWFLVDATDLVLGRLAARLATLLQGKDRPTWTPHVDTGAFVVVTNALKIHVTGNKVKDKMYWTYSEHPGGRKGVPYETMLKKHPEDILYLAVKRMLPKSRLGKSMLGKLKIYAGAEHPHQAQLPQPLKLEV